MILALITLSFSPYWIPSILTVVGLVCIWVNATAHHTHSMDELFNLVVYLFTLALIWTTFFTVMYFTSRS